MADDYKNTVFLPKTAFPMRGGLPQKEPELLAFWAKMDLYKRLREQEKESEQFVLHDGPPYANGNIHIGHAVNKILKDVVNRSYQMLGYNAPYVPGWDCHGLPIEWKIEEKYRAAGKDKDQVPILQFRKECRDFAQHWKDVQSAEFQRLGVVGDWKNPYSTMDFASEAAIAREIHKFALNGGLYRSSKPVMWSVVEKTALAEAEVEYEDYVSDTIWVKFPVSEAKEADLVGVPVVIWTTTPWTIPGNRAISYSNKIDYALYEVTDAPDDNWVKKGEKLILAKALADAVFKQARVAAFKEVRAVKPASIQACDHPLKAMGYRFKVPMLNGDHVTADTGTGFVHTAPGHGADDYNIWIESTAALKAAGIDTIIPYTVDGAGFFTPQAPGFEGKRVLTDKGEKGDANEAVITALKNANALVARDRLKHQYPHSWRSKKPVIFRNTPQWFISMEKNDLRKTALKAIGETTWYPKQGENRIRGMIDQRPDWCISRQRSWGVPIAIFVSKISGEILCDESVFERIYEVFAKEGADAWYARSPQEFLGPSYKAEDYEQIKDIVDVWFESGSSHAFVLDARDDLRDTPADVYLEGSDQHRGWFHSSLLESCGTRGRAPYEAVVTHGFVLDEQGRKMSKSLGNVVAPQEVTEKMGADILRLWVVGADYTEDLRVGPEILKQSTESYRRLRNTLRYLLGALDGFSEAEKIGYDKMPELEHWVLHRLFELDAKVRHSIEKFEFTALLNELHLFCASDLSAFYFDVRKDSLYCDRPDSDKRRAVRTVMNEIFNHLVVWLAPVLCFTAEEAWQSRLAEGGKGEESVHLCLFHQTPESWKNDALAEKWKTIRTVREGVTKALEQERVEKRIGSSLQAHPIVKVVPKYKHIFDKLAFEEVCITSSITVEESKKDLSPDLAEIAFQPAAGHKCERCWRVLEEVGKSSAHPTLCMRCEDAVSKTAKAA
jgi:isoleucyl-tRNA synthetase